MTDKVFGAKNIQIIATTRYPVVSAYEFEFLKGEEVVRERMAGCTLYFVVQRPLTYFSNVVPSNGYLTFDIIDTVHPPLHCKIDMARCGFCGPDETVMIEFQFYKKERDEKPPFNDVAAFKILREDESFVVWETPQKLLYEAIANGLPVAFSGNVNDYLDYHVHYIGKAFAQKVWDRLTGHDKMQKILTMEDTLAAKDKSTRAPFEIALLMLEIEGYDEAVLAVGEDFDGPSGLSPILYELETEEHMAVLIQPSLDLRAPELTTEAEALLINKFKPSYNEVRYDKYPDIEGGTRSARYTHATLLINKLPVVLKTDHHTQTALDGPVELEDD